MLPEDEDKLRELLKNYSAKLVMQRLSILALDVASDCSDDGLKEQAKELSLLSVALDDITSGRPFEV